MILTSVPRRRRRSGRRRRAARWCRAARRGRASRGRRRGRRSSSSTARPAVRTAAAAEAQAAGSAGGVDVHGVPPSSWSVALSVRTDGRRPVRVTRPRLRCCDLWRVTRGGASFVRWRRGSAGTPTDGSTDGHGLSRSRRGDDGLPAGRRARRLVGRVDERRRAERRWRSSIPAVDAVDDVDALVVALFAERRPLARAPGPPVRRRPQRRRGPRPGGLHPPGPQRRAGP